MTQVGLGQVLTKIEEAVERARADPIYDKETLIAQINGIRKRITELGHSELIIDLRL